MVLSVCQKQQLSTWPLVCVAMNKRKQHSSEEASATKRIKLTTFVSVLHIPVADFALKLVEHSQVMDKAVDFVSQYLAFPTLEQLLQHVKEQQHDGDEIFEQEFYFKLEIVKILCMCIFIASQIFAQTRRRGA